MAENSMRLNLIMGLVDKITAPVQKVTNQTSRMAEQVKGSQQELKRLGGMTKDIEHFRELKRGASQTENALQQAQARVNQLAQEMRASENPTQRMTQQFARATAQARRLREQHSREREEIQRLSTGLRDAGVDVNRLDHSTRRIAAQTQRYNRQLEEQQRQLEEVADRQRRLSEVSERNREMRMSATVDAVGVTAAVYGVKQLVDAYGEVSSAQGEIGSLGISADGIAAITEKAKEFSNQWSGTTQADFIRASYDIKSGISSLSDAAVGEFTRIAAMTAGATKSSTAEMTSLFASGFGIYRRQFDQFGGSVIEGWENLSAEERDMKFGEYFSAGIASSVQAFKTDGQNMSAAISNLGATATAANVSFAEQLSILGQLQATMSGSEAATKYRAFLGAAAKAGEDLGLSFMDAENNLRSMPEILEELRGKYGDTIDAVEAQELKKAFGTDEAIGLIQQLYPEIDTLKQNIDGMDQSLRGGMGTTQKMAESILLGPAESFDRLSNRIQNMTAAVGKLFAPAMVFAADVIGGGAIALADFTEKFPVLSQVIAFAVVGLIAFKAASVAGRFAFSFFSDALVTGRKVMDFLTASNLRANAVMALSRVRTMTAAGAMLFMAGTQKALAAGTAVMTGAQWALNAAMMANPVGLIIAGIVALIAVVALVVRYWEPLGAFFSGLWGWIKGVFVAGWEFIKALFMWSPLGLVLQMWEPIKGFFAGLWGGIKNLFSGAWAWIQDTILSPIQAVKDALGGVWDSLFGSDEKGVEVTQKVRQVSEQVPAGMAASVSETEVVPGVSRSPASGGGVAASASVGSGPAITNQYGDIIIHAAEGMSPEDVAREVRRQLDERDRSAAQRARSRLYD